MYGHNKQCLNWRILTLMVGWLHLLIAFANTTGLVIYMCQYLRVDYGGDTFQGVELNAHRPSAALILWFIFSITMTTFAGILLHGMQEERLKLMAPFVYGNFILIGWLHLIVATFSSLGLVIYMSQYDNEIYQGVKNHGIELGGLILWLLFSMISAIFAAVLLIGFKQERRKILTPFVYPNYEAKLLS